MPFRSGKYHSHFRVRRISECAAFLNAPHLGMLSPRNQNRTCWLGTFAPDLASKG